MSSGPEWYTFPEDEYERLTYVAQFKNPRQILNEFESNIEYVSDNGQYSADSWIFIIKK